MAGHPTDAIVDDLTRVYAANIRRLEGIVSAGLRRGLDPARLGTTDQRVGDATLAYRQRQREQAHAILDELDKAGRTAGPIVVGRAYGSGVVSVDRAIASKRVRLTGEFGRIHTRAVDALAGNMSRSLTAAAEQARTSVDLVFDRADALTGALPARGGIGGVPFLGRRVNDPYRRLALEVVTGGVIGLDTRRQVSQALARRLVNDGVTDAVTGFIDRAGRRWPLDTYAGMVARTTTREAMTAGTTNRLREHGVDLVTITSHPHKADECSPYDGNTFSLDGSTPGYPVLDELPPFHPNCVHVVTPASADLDAFEAELEAGVGADVDRPRITDSPPTPPQPPLSRHAQPQHAPGTEERLALQRLIDNDPGPDVDAASAYWEGIDAEDYRRSQTGTDAKAARRVRLARRAALRDTMRPELARELGFVRGTRPKKWATEEDVGDRLLAGELTIDEAEELAYQHYNTRELKAISRENTQAANYGSETKPIPCFACGKYKRRPADVCPSCADDPVQLNTTAAEFNAAFGYFGEGSEHRRGLHYGYTDYEREEKVGRWVF